MLNSCAPSSREAAHLTAVCGGWPCERVWENRGQSDDYACESRSCHSMWGHQWFPQILFIYLFFLESIFKRSPGLLCVALSPWKCSALSVVSSGLTSRKQGCIMKTSLYFYEIFSSLRNTTANYWSYVKVSVFLG